MQNCPALKGVHVRASVSPAGLSASPECSDTQAPDDLAFSSRLYLSGRFPLEGDGAGAPAGIRNRQNGSTYQDVSRWRGTVAGAPVEIQESEGESPTHAANYITKQLRKMLWREMGGPAWWFQPPRRGFAGSPWSMRSEQKL